MMAPLFAIYRTLYRTMYRSLAIRLAATRRDGEWSQWLRLTRIISSSTG